jgi:hypothetical protein
MADIICFDKGGRDARRALVAEGRAPREFFYGVMDLQERGYDIEQRSSAEPYTGPLAAMYRGVELAWSHLTRLGLRTHCLDEIQDKMCRTRVAVSFTDGFSLTLGYYYRNICEGAPFLIGCFHGLSDLENRPAEAMRPLVRRLIRQSLHRLDHIAFFGPADREFGITRYGLDREKTSVILFGVDTGFWTPGVVPAEDFVFSMGQDPNRDFATLVGAEIDAPLRLHTALPVVVPPGRSNVTLSKGSYHKSTLTDEELRDLYRRALAVVVPLKDVYQPTGYSVTLQAMACGKPVVLSRIRGLWGAGTPARRRELPAGAARRPAPRWQPPLRASPPIRNCACALGQEARNTAEKYFNPAAAASSLEALIQHGLATRPKPVAAVRNGAQA